MVRVLRDLRDITDEQACQIFRTDIGCDDRSTFRHYLVPILELREFDLAAVHHGKISAHDTGVGGRCDHSADAARVVDDRADRGPVLSRLRDDPDQAASGKHVHVDRETVRPGDVLVALPSSGVHSNGFSLVRKVFDVENDCPRELLESLLTPTKLYVKPVLALLDAVNVKSIAHITGGGFFENIPRALGPGLTAHIARKDVRVLPIFDRIAQAGDIPERDMFNTFNMGVGMVTIVSPEDADRALEILRAQGEDAYILGTVREGAEGVVLA